jgi:hypothetical protein
MPKNARQGKKQSAVQAASSGIMTDFRLYFKTVVFGLVLFAVFYAYTSWQGLPSVLNKTVADVSIVLIGLSMILSSLCYFWNYWDSKIIYRKYLGIVGFGAVLIHLALSFSLVKKLFAIDYWLQSKSLAFTTGGAAVIIFLIMTLISNRLAAAGLGGRLWRGILRTGYLGVALIWLHVYLLKTKHWMTWYQDGMTSLPSLSMLVTVFMTLVILMRVALWLALRRQMGRLA